jgi:hypothetical protein
MRDMDEMQSTPLPERALKVALARLMLALAEDDDETSFITRETELRILGLLVILQRRERWQPEHVALLAGARAWFRPRPWYHRLALDVVLRVAEGLPLPDEFYVNLWVGNSSVRDWLMEIAWVAREQMEPRRAVRELARNVEACNFGNWPAILQWMLEVHPGTAMQALADYVPLRSRSDYDARLAQFFEDTEIDYVTTLMEAEAEAGRLAQGAASK